MKTLIAGLAALALVALSSPAGAQWLGQPVPYGYPYAMPAYPPPAYGYGYPAYPYYPYYPYYYPYPLPPAPSLGFGRGGIYGHVFVPRSEGIYSFTLPGGAR